MQAKLTCLFLRSYSCTQPWIVLQRIALEIDAISPCANQRAHRCCLSQSIVRWRRERISSKSLARKLTNDAKRAGNWRTQFVDNAATSARSSSHKLYQWKAKIRTQPITRKTRQSVEISSAAYAAAEISASSRIRAEWEASRKISLWYAAISKTVHATVPRVNTCTWPIKKRRNTCGRDSFQALLAGGVVGILMFLSAKISSTTSVTAARAVSFATCRRKQCMAAEVAEGITTNPRENDPVTQWITSIGTSWKKTSRCVEKCQSYKRMSPTFELPTTSCWSKMPDIEDPGGVVPPLTAEGMEPMVTVILRLAWVTLRVIPTLLRVPTVLTAPPQNRLEPLVTMVTQSLNENILDFCNYFYATL